MTGAAGNGVRLLDKTLSGRNIEDHMVNVISAYLSKTIDAYRGVCTASMIREAISDGALFVHKDGVLGLRNERDNLWEVLFFVSENPVARKSLVAEAGKKLGKVDILFSREKYSGRQRKYGPELWMRLA